MFQNVKRIFPPSNIFLQAELTDLCEKELPWASMAVMKLLPKSTLT